MAAYIVEFYCPASRVVVMLDGKSHAEQGNYGAVRTVRLEALGNRVIILTNHDVAADLDGAQMRILAACRRVMLRSRSGAIGRESRLGFLLPRLFGPLTLPSPRKAGRGCNSAARTFGPLFLRSPCSAGRG